MIEKSIEVIETLTKYAIETPSDQHLLEILSTRELVILDLIKQIKEKK